MQNQTEKKISSGLLEIYILSCCSFNVFFYDKNQWRAGKGFFSPPPPKKYQFITKAYWWLQTTRTQINPFVYIRSMLLFTCQIRQEEVLFFGFPHFSNILAHFCASPWSQSLLWLVCWHKILLLSYAVWLAFSWD